MAASQISSILERILDRTEMTFWFASFSSETPDARGYERECQDYLSGGERMLGAFEDPRLQEERGIRHGKLGFASFLKKAVTS